MLAAAQLDRWCLDIFGMLLLLLLLLLLRLGYSEDDNALFKSISLKLGLRAWF